jgi:hypothetical protein
MKVAVWDVVLIKETGEAFEVRRKNSVYGAKVLH